MSLKISKTKVYCFEPNTNKYRKIGNIVGDHFFKKVGPEHFMRVCNGYGIQYDAITQFIPNGIKKIEVIEKHTGVTWQSSVEDWLKSGRAADYGRGKQIFLSLKYMRQKNKMAIQREKEEKEAIRSKTISQSSLF